MDKKQKNSVGGDEPAGPARHGQLFTGLNINGIKKQTLIPL